MKKKPSHRDAINKLADEAAERVRAAGFNHKRFRNACVRAMVNAAVEQCSNKSMFVRVWRSILITETAKGIEEATRKRAAATLSRFERSKATATSPDRREQALRHLRDESTIGIPPTSNAPQTPVEGGS